uniref:Uncharacterized protein n=1 Tax=Candidatus Kentrum sp. SD TaxID=2126332 RepID=A0A450YFX7_9GAMM|nr:MAG: hypothetical protein BECKSD772F_GA0070984_100521 [Candidatus Kentron sp. SD]VFK40375.1 MAG: hypothetical protein BECKSD772E_GA0070983_100621 [Candidatus Kentron sp. SD]
MLGKKRIADKKTCSEKNINPNASRSAMFFYWLALRAWLQTGCSLRGRQFVRDFYFSET